jgi:hypothetical protein
MLILVHVSVALLGLLAATHAAILRARWSLRASYGLVAATFVTGAALVLQAHAPLASACLSGLMYVAVATPLLVMARYRLGHQI